MRNTPLTAAALSCALALLLAGCGGSSSAAPSDGGSAGETPEGPLDALFAKVIPEYDEAAYAELNQKQEEAVAACMSDLGFEYTPQAADTAVSADTDDGPQWGTREYAEQYGYGFSTTTESAEGEMEQEEWVDPNADYLATLSESQQTAFNEALYGVPVESDDPDEAQEYNWEDSGCYGKASHEVYETGAFAALSDPDFAALEEDMSALYEQAESNPQLTEVTAQWTSCMSDAGYDFATPDEAQQSINDQMSELYGWNVEWTEDMTEPPTPDPAAVAELRTLELATALADFTCKEKVDYEAKQLEVMFDLQQQFIDAHQTELDAWVEKYAQSTK